SEKPRRALQSVRFDELVVVRHEDRFHEVRMLQKKRRPSGQREADDIVRTTGKALEKRKRVALDPAKAPKGALKVRGVSDGHAASGMLYPSPVSAERDTIGEGDRGWEAFAAREPYFAV